MKPNKIPILASMAYLLCASSASSATFFTDRAAFEAASGVLTTEDFADGTFAPGMTASTDNGSISGGLWSDNVTPPLNLAFIGLIPRNQTTFGFGSGQLSFGADFDLGPGGAGKGIQFVLDGTDVLATQLFTTVPTFFGFIANTAFNSVTLRSGTAAPLGTGEQYTLDNLTFAGAVVPAAVPLPGSLALLLAGLGGMSVLRHGRKLG